MKIRNILIVCILLAGIGFLAYGQTNTQTKNEVIVHTEIVNNDENTILPEEEIQKGIWVSFLDYEECIDESDGKKLRESFSKMFAKISEKGFNTVYLQVRAYGDAYYKSKLFPMASKAGQVMAADGTDFLKTAIEEAHKQHLAVHAWINPFRLMKPEEMSLISEKYPIRQWYDDDLKRGDWIVLCGDRLYLNPAYEEVWQLVADGVSEIIDQYDVDGVQIDDYFYPTTDEIFDEKAYSKLGEGSDLASWRMTNVDSMVTKLSQTVHDSEKNLVFGISPQGVVQNNYDSLYADVEKWCSSTVYCDYILPQIYFGFEHETAGYEQLIDQWNEMTNHSEVALVIGLAGYKIGTEDMNAGENGLREWVEETDVLNRQIKAASELSNYGGIAVFRYASLFEPQEEVKSLVDSEMKQISIK